MLHEDAKDNLLELGAVILLLGLLKLGFSPVRRSRLLLPLTDAGGQAE